MDLMQWIDIVVAVLSIPAAYLGAVQAFKMFNKNTRLSKLESRISHTEEAVQAVLHDSLYKQCIRCISRDSITASELDNIEHLYEGYSGVGGNGTGRALYQKAMSLPVIDDSKLIEKEKNHEI